MAFASLTIDLNARLANIESDLGKMAHLAEKQNQRMQTAFAKTGQVAAAALSALGVGGLAAFVKSSIDAADNLNDLSKKTGVAVESLSGFDLLAKSSGASLEDIATSVGRLNKSMGEAAGGNKEIAATLKALGVTAKTPEEALYQIADAFGRFKNEGDKARALSQVLGRSWQSLAPALAEGGAGMRAIVEEGKRLNPVTREMAEQADKFNDAMARFKVEAAGVGTSIATEILPALNKMLGDMSEGIKIFGSFGNALMSIGLGTNPFDSVTEGLTKYRAEVKRLKGLQAGARPEFAAMLDPQIKEAEKKLDWYKHLQGQQALALNDQYGTGNYKMPSAAAPKKISLKSSGAGNKSGKTGTSAARMSETEWAMEETAHMTRTLYQIGEEMEAARQAAFERATESADAWQDSLDAANARLNEAARGWKDLIDPVEQYRRELAEIDQLQSEGLLNAEQATEARMIINERIDGIHKTNDALEKQNSIGEELGLTFSSAFEDAVIAGKDFQSVLESIGQDITRIFLRKMVTEPLADAASGLFKGFDFGSIFGGARAAGGPVSGGTAYLVGERGPELFVPKNAGNIVPNAAANSGSRAVVINMNVQASDAGSFRRSMGQIKADLAFAVGSAQRNM